MYSEPYEHLGAKRRGINSVEQGLGVLQAVVDLQRAGTLKEIANKAGMDSSQTHRYVSSLVNCGMLQQDPATGRYDLGPTSLRTGLAAVARQDSLTRAEGAARMLSEESGATSLLSVWTASGPTVVRWNHGAPPVYTVLTIGSVLSTSTSSTGRVFMAFLPEALLNPVLKAEGKGALADEPALLADRQSVRSSFIAAVNSTFIPGLRAYSAPVLGVHNSVVAAITVVASDGIPRSVDEFYQTSLLEACAKATHDLGGSWRGPRT